VKISLEVIPDESFKNRYRTREPFFSRSRQLDLALVVVLILKKSVKSLQSMLNEVVGILGVGTISNSAFTQRRAQLKPAAFIELNQRVIVNVRYRDEDLKRYKHMRVLGIDGSKVLLPDTPDVINEFGTISYSNDHPDVHGQHAYALASVRYDVLNHIALDSILGQTHDYEVDLATQHLAHTHDND
jgi:hypothetical protein